MEEKGNKSEVCSTRFMGSGILKDFAFRVLVPITHSFSSNVETLPFEVRTKRSPTCSLTKEGRCLKVWIPSQMGLSACRLSQFPHRLVVFPAPDDFLFTCLRSPSTIPQPSFPMIPPHLSHFLITSYPGLAHCFISHHRHHNINHQLHQHIATSRITPTISSLLLLRAALTSNSFFAEDLTSSHEPITKSISAVLSISTYISAQVQHEKGHSQSPMKSAQPSYRLSLYTCHSKQVLEIGEVGGELC
jgi:hypothetical protein